MVVILLYSFFIIFFLKLITLFFKIKGTFTFHVWNDKLLLSRGPLIQLEGNCGSIEQSLNRLFFCRLLCLAFAFRFGVGFGGGRDSYSSSSKVSFFSGNWFYSLVISCDFGRSPGPFQRLVTLFYDVCSCM